jgi:hypothetical protein
MFDDVFAPEGRHAASPGGGGFGLHCEKGAASAFTVQCRLQNDNALVARASGAESLCPLSVFVRCLSR